MQHYEIAERFHRAYNGRRNFMTPDIISYGKAGRLLWELSHGDGIDGERIYGVTVIDIRGAPIRDLSGCFMSRQAAESHIKANIKGST